MFQGARCGNVKISAYPRKSITGRAYSRGYSSMLRGIMMMVSAACRRVVITLGRSSRARAKKHDPREGHNQARSSYGVLGLANCDCSRYLPFPLSPSVSSFSSPPRNTCRRPARARNAAVAASCGGDFLATTTTTKMANEGRERIN